MKKVNIIIFVVVILGIISIFGYAIWDANKSLSKVNENNMEQMIGENNELNESIMEQNKVSENEVNGDIGSNTDYIGTWYISEETYLNSEKIDEILDRREENLISNEEFENQMNSESNSNIVKLDIDEYVENKIKFDFTLTSPAPTQREGKLEDIIVELTNGVGMFTYTDNWGTSGNGIITLGEDKIELRLETTKVAQGAQWGVEGVYTFSYKTLD